MKRFYLTLIVSSAFGCAFGQHVVTTNEQYDNPTVKNKDIERNFYSILYHAYEFKEPRYSGAYGVMIDGLNMYNTPWGITAGFEGNWGLAPGSGTGTVIFGPNIGKTFGNTNDIRVFMPVAYGLSMTYSKEQKETLFSHSLIILPSVIKMISDDFGLRAGLSLATDFSYFNAGFLVGIVF